MADVLGMKKGLEQIVDEVKSFDVRIPIFFSRDGFKAVFARCRRNSFILADRVVTEGTVDKSDRFLSVDERIEAESFPLRMLSLLKDGSWVEDNADGGPDSSLWKVTGFVSFS